jgi:hypothetical protein
MFEKYTIQELESYLNLLEKNLDYISLKRKLNPTKRYNEMTDLLINLREKLYSEINTRFETLAKEYENSKKNIQ